MAEWFWGKEYTVYFTNGGMEGLYEGFMLLGKKLPATESLSETLAHFQKLLDYPYGCRAFKIEEPPEGFTDKHFVELARLVNLFCIELTKAESELETTGLFWSLDARLNFLARLMNVYALIESHLLEKAISLPKMQIPLSPEEEISVERQRLLAVYDQTKNSLSSSERLKLWERIVELSEQDKISMNPALLSLAYFAYVDLIDDSFTKEKQIAIWKRFLEIETEIGEPEEIELIREILEDIEKE